MSEAELGFDVLETNEDELAALMRRGTQLTHTWPGSRPHGVLWRKCPWVVPIICDMRGIAISDELRERFNTRLPDK